jgi:mono/diheme cytochrome c family protein
MTLSRSVAGYSILVLAIHSRSVSAKPVEGRIVEVWARGDAPSGAGAAHARSLRVDLDALPSSDAERYDAQYDEVARYRGVSLREVIRPFSPGAQLDLAILHFANGMAVPIPFRDRAVMKRLDPFVARAYRSHSAGDLAIGTFPTIHDAGGPADRRTIAFSGNKVVVAQRWHPEVAAAAEPGFSPWARADTLVSIELVSTRPYYAQFDIDGDSSIRRGLALYRQSCQFCHGARHVGASFGWDFVDSPPIYDYHNSAANLYHNVAYKPRNATDLGLLMPALGFLTEEDAGCLQSWLRAIAIRPMPAYVPPAGARTRSRQHP